MQSAFLTNNKVIIMKAAGDMSYDELELDIPS